MYTCRIRTTFVLSIFLFFRSFLMLVTRCSLYRFALALPASCHNTYIFVVECVCLTHTGCRCKLSDPTTRHFRICVRWTRGRVVLILSSPICLCDCDVSPSFFTSISHNKLIFMNCRGFRENGNFVCSSNVAYVIHNEHAFSQVRRNMTRNT